MKKINFKSLIAVVSVFLSFTFISSCYYDNQEELHPKVDNPVGCDTVGVMTYTKNIAPIMLASCGSNNTGCHQVATNSNFNIALNSYAAINAVDTTQLISTIVQDGNYNSMPKGGSKLSDCDISIIQKWINTGKQN